MYAWLKQKGAAKPTLSVSTLLACSNDRYVNILLTYIQKVQLFLGSLIGLKFFLVNDCNIQFVFYFIYINLQVSLAFLVAAFFLNVKTATGLISSIEVADNIARMNQYFTLTFSIKHDMTNSDMISHRLYDGVCKWTLGIIPFPVLSPG